MIETTRKPRGNLRTRAWAALAAAAATLSVPALALAQEFQKVDGKLGEEVPAGPFVGIAYGFIWIAILGYVLYVARGLGRVRGDLEELRRKLDAAGKR
jgi:CcmD family protein